MRNLIKKIGCEIIYRTGLFKLATFNTRIIAFHKVNPEYFEKQINHLVKHYKVLPLNEIFSSDKNSVVITFDDGYKNNLEYAYPILKKYNLAATVFVTYKFIDENIFAWWDRLEYSRKHADLSMLKSMNPYKIEKEITKLTDLNENARKPKEYDFMNWDDLKQVTDVFEIGSHTLTHPILTNIPLEDAEKEIIESKNKIEEKVGKQISYFAYPNGNYNDELIEFVKKAGYKYAVTYEKGKNQTNNYTLHRRGINVKDNLAIFAAKVAGVF